MFSGLPVYAETVDPFVGGPDFLAGGGGNDVMFGGDGADSMAGNLGEDIMIGDYGHVIFEDGIAKSIYAPGDFFVSILFGLYASSGETFPMDLWSSIPSWVGTGMGTSFQWLTQMGLWMGRFNLFALHGMEMSMPGKETTILPDGTTVLTLPDGTTSVTSPDGTITTTAPNGGTIVVLPDGTIIMTAPDGTVVKILPDGTNITTAPDGTTTTVLPDGTITVSQLHDPEPGPAQDLSTGEGMFADIGLGAVVAGLSGWKVASSGRTGKRRRLKHESFRELEREMDNRRFLRWNNGEWTHIGPWHVDGPNEDRPSFRNHTGYRFDS